MASSDPFTDTPTAPPPLPAPLVDYALAYATGGWKVFPCCAPVPGGGCNVRHHTTTTVDEQTGQRVEHPCAHPGKSPIPANGHNAATTDRARIRRWWTEHPDANIGLHCGASCIVVLDADAPRPGKSDDGLSSLLTLFEVVAAANGTTAEDLEPVGAHVVTPSGGLHYYYRLPEVMRDRGWEVKSRNGAFTGHPGVDVKSTGGYVILPPSLHHTGARYLWDPPTRQWWDVPDLPLGLVAALDHHRLLRNPERDQAERDARRAEAATRPALDDVAVELLLGQIVAEVLPLGESAAWEKQVWDERTRQWRWEAHAGRNDFLYRQVACRAWDALAGMWAEDQAAAASTLLGVLRDANARLTTPLDDVDLGRIADSARKRDPVTPPVPPVLSVGGRVVTQNHEPRVRVTGGATTPPPSTSAPRRGRSKRPPRGTAAQSLAAIRAARGR